MQAMFDHVQHTDQPSNTDALYRYLLPHVRHCLEVVVQNEFEDSSAAVTTFSLEFRFSDGSSMEKWVRNASTGHHAEIILHGRILEVFAHWVRQKSRELDQMISTLQTGQHALGTRAQNCKRKLEKACYQGFSVVEVLAEFIFTTIVDIVGMDAACLGSLLAGQLMAEGNQQELLCMCEWPTTLLSVIVCKLGQLQAKVSKIVMELYAESGFQSYDESKNSLMMFFPYYTVETTTGTLEVHECSTESVYAESPFRVELIDSFGLLFRLLRHLEFLCNGGSNCHEVTIAVDFEGVKLCRHGALCLVQMTCSDDPTLVYVLDIHLLGRRAFTMTTPEGTSMKNVLESEEIRKVWFDPRNDVDALYHQFGIMPRGIFDLQLAEVADRRNRGLNVHFVQGLFKCLTQCPSLQDEQKVFAEKINTMGKSLFEPQNGGNYEVFQQRPLNPVILVYAAHDSRYMLVLYEQYLTSIGDRWAPRVFQAGQDRAHWCLNPDYVVPNSEAPDF